MRPAASRAIPLVHSNFMLQFTFWPLMWPRSLELWATFCLHFYLLFAYSKYIFASWFLLHLITLALRRIHFTKPLIVYRVAPFSVWNVLYPSTGCCSSRMWKYLGYKNINVVTIGQEGGNKIWRDQRGGGGIFKIVTIVHTNCNNAIKYREVTHYECSEIMKTTERLSSKFRWWHKN